MQIYANEFFRYHLTLSNMLKARVLTQITYIYAKVATKILAILQITRRHLNNRYFPYVAVVWCIGGICQFTIVDGSEVDLKRAEQLTCV